MSQPDENEEDAVLSVEEALAMLHVRDGERVHTFLNPGTSLLVGADWDKAEVEELIRTTRHRRRAGPEARAMKHGLVLWDRGRWLFVETKSPP